MKITQILSITLIGTILLSTLIGCGSSNDNDANNTVKKTELEGVWEACYNQSNQSFLSRVTYSGNKCEEEIFNTENSDCTGNETLVYSWGATFTIGDSFTTQSGVIAKEIDLVDRDDGEIIYDIFYINNDRHYIGDISTGIGQSPQTRPTDIDFSIYWTKVGP